MRAGSARPSYLVNRSVDLTVMGGLAIATYAVFRWMPSVASGGYQRPLLVALTWSVSYPHFASTSMRLYGSRQSLRQYPMTAVVTPILFGAVIVAAFVSPGSIAPALVKLYNSWSPFHFSGQTIGLTVLYARRCGVEVDRRARRLLTWFVLSTAVFFSARLESTTGELRFFGVVYPSLHLPAWTAQGTRLAMWGLGAVAAVALLRRVVTTRVAVPVIVVVPALAQFVWFTTVPIAAYANLVPFFHSLQYLLVAWSFQRGTRSVASGSTPARRVVASTAARWMATNIALGYALFWLLPIVGTGSGRSPAFSTAVILAGIQLHHFFVDGVIWRLRTPSVAGPLTSSLAHVPEREVHEAALA